MCKSGQSKNQNRPETYKSAFIVVKDGEENTIGGWARCLKSDKNPFGREYTTNMINHYAQRKQFGFSFKEYPDLLDEIWKEVPGSQSSKGHWKISNMNRMKYITKHAENVLSEERLWLNNGYPAIKFNGKQQYCHILSFMTFFPEEYDNKKSNEIVLHEHDDKIDFRPHKLRIGTHSQNRTDAHNNGKHDGTKTMRMRCVSYIKGVFEKEYESQTDAMKYLKTIGFDKAYSAKIGMVLEGTRKTAYGRTWKIV